MRSLQVVNYLSDTRVSSKLSDSRGTPGHNRWQIIYLIQVGNIHAAELLVPLVNLSVHSIYKIVESYNHSGASALVYKKAEGEDHYLALMKKFLFLHHWKHWLPKVLSKQPMIFVTLLRKKPANPFPMIISGTYYTAMAGKRKCPGLIIPNEVLKNKPTLKKTTRKAGVRRSNIPDHITCITGCCIF